MYFAADAFPCIRRVLLDDRHAQRRHAHAAHAAGGQHRAGAHRLPLPLHHTVSPTRARSESRSALLRRRTSLLVSFPDTLPKVCTAFEQTKAHAYVRLRFLTLCADLDTKGIHEVASAHARLPLPCALAHAHTFTDTHALRRRSPRAASALWPPVRHSPSTLPAAHQLKHRASYPCAHTRLRCVHRSPARVRGAARYAQLEPNFQPLHRAHTHPTPCSSIE